MKVLLAGYGKMGQFIFRELKKSEYADEIAICDIKFEKNYEEDGIRYYRSLAETDIPYFDCIFVATPANTHCEVLEDLITRGAKNIYVEKPAVVNTEEFNRIAAIKGDCRIVSGYILRQTECMSSLRNIMSGLYDDGFRLEVCSVTYQKFLPVSHEERAKNDIGVFEEIVHVWDLIFNYFGLRCADIVHFCSRLETDREKEGRFIFADLSYLLHSEDCNALVHITSSFKAVSKKREFQFFFKDCDGNRRNVFLSFDNADNTDRVCVTDAHDTTIYRGEYPALTKLEQQTREVFRYFETGTRKNLALFEESETINSLIERVGISLSY